MGLFQFFYFKKIILSSSLYICNYSPNVSQFLLCQFYEGEEKNHVQRATSHTVLIFKEKNMLPAFTTLDLHTVIVIVIVEKCTYVLGADHHGLFQFIKTNSHKKYNIMYSQNGPLIKVLSLHAVGQSATSLKKISLYVFFLLLIRLKFHFGLNKLCQTTDYSYNEYLNDNY